MKIKRLQPDVFLLSDFPLLGKSEDVRLTWLIHDLFRLPFIYRVDLEPRAQAALLAVDRDESDLEKPWREFKAALPSFLERAVTARDEQPPSLFLTPPASGPIRVFRYGEGMSTWQVMHASEGRLRARHAAIRRQPALSARIMDALVSTPGVEAVRVNHRAGSLTLAFEPDRIAPTQLPLLLEKLLSLPASLKPGAAGSGIQNAVASASLLAATGLEAGLEALDPLCAILVSSTGFPTIRTAWERFKKGDIGSEALETLQITLSLLSGRYLPGALHALSVLVWKNYSRNVLADKARAAAEAFPNPDGKEAATRLQALAAAAETEDSAHLFAEEAILPLLLVGLSVGLLDGPESAAAVLRTNFETGPLLTDRLSLLTAAVRLGRAGVVLTRPDALESAAAAQVWLICCAESEPVQQLLPIMRRVTGARLIFFHDSGAVAHSDEALARFLPPGPLRVEERRALVKRLRRAGLKTGLLSGKGDKEALKASCAPLFWGPPDSGSVGGVSIPGAETLRPLIALLAEAKLHAARVERGRLIATIPNLIGSTGALFGLWGSLTNVFISNAGILAGWLEGQARLDEEINSRSKSAF